MLNCPEFYSPLQHSVHVHRSYRFFMGCTERLTVLSTVATTHGTLISAWLFRGFADSVVGVPGLPPPLRRPLA
eukprot:952497-Amphidinium_carterae.1